jgi:hypothetical protein
MVKCVSFLGVLFFSVLISQEPASAYVLVEKQRDKILVVYDSKPPETCSSTLAAGLQSENVDPVLNGLKSSKVRELEHDDCQIAITAKPGTDLTLYTLLAAGPSVFDSLEKWGKFVSKGYSKLKGNLRLKGGPLLLAEKGALQKFADELLSLPTMPTGTPNYGDALVLADGVKSQEGVKPMAERIARYMAKNYPNSKAQVVKADLMRQPKAEEVYDCPVQTPLIENEIYILNLQRELYGIAKEAKLPSDLPIPLRLDNTAETWVASLGDKKFNTIVMTSGLCNCNSKERACCGIGKIETKKFIENVLAHLKPGGIAVLEGTGPSALVEDFFKAAAVQGSKIERRIEKYEKGDSSVIVFQKKL